MKFKTKIKIIKIMALIGVFMGAYICMEGKPTFSRIVGGILSSSLLGVFYLVLPTGEEIDG